MFAGKTTEMMRLIRRETFARKKVFVVNHVFDTRYSHNSIESHDHQKMPSISVNYLNQIFDMDEYIDADVIAIDEAQFFEDLKDSVLRMINIDSKKVYVAGLNAKYDRTPFGQICCLIPEAEKIDKLCAVCFNCGEFANFTRLFKSNSKNIIIGSSDKYAATCRKHHVIPNK